MEASQSLAKEILCSNCFMGNSFEVTPLKQRETFQMMEQMNLWVHTSDDVRYDLQCLYHMMNRGGGHTFFPQFNLLFECSVLPLHLLHQTFPQFNLNGETGISAVVPYSNAINLLAQQSPINFMETSWLGAGLDSHAHYTVWHKMCVFSQSH